MEIVTTVFDERYNQFTGPNDFVIPFVPKFLLLENAECEVYQTQKPLQISRKELIHTWIEQGKGISEFRVPRFPSHFKRQRKCNISPDTESHMKVRISSDYVTIFKSCMKDCWDFAVGKEKLRETEIEEASDLVAIAEDYKLRSGLNPESN